MADDNNNLSRNGILIAIGVVVIVGTISSAFSSANTVQILGFCGMICVSLFTLLSQGQIAAKTEEVKTTLEKTTAKSEQRMDEIQKTGDKTHSLVNSAMGAQLKLTAELSRWKANQTKQPADEVAALKAERDWREHEEKQARIDAKEAKQNTLPQSPVAPVAVTFVDPQPVIVVEKTEEKEKPS